MPAIDALVEAPVPTAPLPAAETPRAAAPAPLPRVTVPDLEHGSEGVHVEPARVTVEIPHLDALTLEIERIPTSEIQQIDAPPVMQASVTYVAPDVLPRGPESKTVVVAADLAMSRTSSTVTAVVAPAPLFGSSRQTSTRRPGLVLATLMGAIAALLIIALVLATRSPETAVPTPEAPAVNTATPTGKLPEVIPSPAPAAGETPAAAAAQPEPTPAVKPEPETEAPVAVPAPAVAAAAPAPAAPRAAGKRPEEELEPLFRVAAPAPVMAKKSRPRPARLAPKAGAAVTSPAPADAAKQPVSADKDFSFLEGGDAPAGVELKRPSSFSP